MSLSPNLEKLINSIKHLTPDEIRQKFNAPQAQSALHAVLFQPDECIKLSNQISGNRFEALLSTVSNEFILSNVQSAFKLKELISELKPMSADEIQQIKRNKNLQVLNLRVNYLVILLKNLSLKQIEAFSAHFGAQIVKTVILTSKSLSSVLQKLSYQQSKAFIDGLYEQLPCLIFDQKTFCDAIDGVSMAQCRLLCESMKSQLSSIANDGINLSYLFALLSNEHCKIAASVFRDELPNILISAFDACNIFTSLTKAKCQIVCHALGDTLLTILPPEEVDTQQAIKYLSPVNKPIVIAHLSPHNSIHGTLSHQLQQFKQGVLGMFSHKGQEIDPISDNHDILHP